MHNIDRTQLETSDEFEADSFEFQEEAEFAAPFDEIEETELASELMEIADEAELDQFLGKLIRRAGKAVGQAVRSPLGRAVGGYLKGALKSSLPNFGGVLGVIAPALGGFTSAAAPSGNGAGSVVDPAAADAGMDEPDRSESAGDQEFEVARDLVRMAGTAVSNALQSPQVGGLQNLARSAVQAAANAHAPGLLGRSGAGVSARNSGRWYRRDGGIVVEGL
jgi:hypothetical protein